MIPKHARLGQSAFYAISSETVSARSGCVDGSLFGDKGIDNKDIRTPQRPGTVNVPLVGGLGLTSPPEKIVREYRVLQTRIEEAMSGFTRSDSMRVRYISWFKVSQTACSDTFIDNAYACQMTVGLVSGKYGRGESERGVAPKIDVEAVLT